MFRRLTLAFVTCVPLAAAADGDPVADRLVASVEARYRTVDVIEASFVQTAHNPVFGDDVQRGTVVMSRPSRMRWTFEGGEREFVTDGQMMWAYSRPDNQVVRYQNVRQQAGSVESLLTSLDSLDELFEVRSVPGTTNTLVLTPRQEAGVKSVKLVLTSDLLIDDIAITDTFDNVTELDFSNVRLNSPVAATTFSFVAPVGTQVIDAGSM